MPGARPLHHRAHALKISCQLKKKNLTTKIWQELAIDFFFFLKKKFFHRGGYLFHVTKEENSFIGM